MEIKNLQNNNRKIIASLGDFSILESQKDESVAPWNAESQYYMAQMGVKRRQVIINVREKNTIIIQAGSMQWTAGNVYATTGVKGVGDLFGKMVKGAVTKESVIKPEYTGNGLLILEPTYKYLILQDISQWGQSGMTIEDGMFLACDGTVKHNVVSRSNFSSAIAGGEGLFNLSLSGTGVVCLESNVPVSELIEVNLNNEELRIDGHLAVCWSSSLQFTVERSSKTLLGSAVSGEGLVNVYRGNGKILMSPYAPTSSLYRAATT